MRHHRPVLSPITGVNCEQGAWGRFSYHYRLRRVEEGTRRACSAQFLSRAAAALRSYGCCRARPHWEPPTPCTHTSDWVGRGWRGLSSNTGTLGECARPGEASAVHFTFYSVSTVKRGGFTITPSRPVLDMVHRKADRTARPRQDTGLCRERGVQDRARVSPLMIENSGK